MDRQDGAVVVAQGEVIVTGQGEVDVAAVG